ncbi:hypothetical protein JYT32_00915, partial [Dehalococcoides mccartyi]|nr:hypothetical protein [Dehalococcoides mccartyi]
MLFKRIGLDDFASAGVRQTILRHKLAVFLVIVFSVLVPFLEVAFIGNLYWIIDPTEEVALLKWFQSIFTAFLGVDSDSKIPVFGLAAGLLTLAVTSKVILRYLLAKIWYSVFLSASIGLISDYVEAPHYKVTFTDQQAISNATQRESEHYATFTINIVMLAALPISVAVFLIASYAISPLLA